MSTPNIGLAHSPSRIHALVLWLVLGLLALIASQARAQTPHGEYLDGKASTVAVILAHGQGLDPDSQVVGPLRKAIHAELGFHTLSLQMPVVAGARTPDKFTEYASTFPEAYKTIQAAIDFLRKDKGVERIYLMGYSMGARMTTGFLAEHPDSGVTGFIGVGLLGGGPVPLNTHANLKKVKLPVIDIHADTGSDATSAEFRKPLVSDGYTQVVLSGAQHSFAGYDRQITAAAIAWLRQREPPK